MKGRKIVRSVQRSDVDWLISKGYLKIVNGKIDSLVVTGKNHVSRDKNLFVPNWMAEKLKFKNK
jgi:hypothetical protein